MIVSFMTFCINILQNGKVVDVTGDYFIQNILLVVASQREGRIQNWRLQTRVELIHLYLSVTILSRGVGMNSCLYVPMIILPKNRMYTSLISQKLVFFNF